MFNIWCMFFQVLQIETLVPVACFFAKRFIKAGEELSYSYGSDDRLYQWRGEQTSPKSVADILVEHITKLA